ncbi:MAG: class I SAM-dependent methyltransferase [Pseudomonadota bacterium]
MRPIATIDFERESLRDGLRRHRVSTAAPTFFSWLGATMYLKEDAIDAALRSVAAFPKESEIVLTFALTGDAPSVARRAASYGEPWVSCFAPDAIEAKLRSAGFADVVPLAPEEAEAGYFRGRSGDLPVPKRTNILYAVV